ncbi:MAG: hypothetical protein JSU06_13960 [Actinobacteria bacterium]|nr:hypothetical protein [Actinomycetota bacterium]
MNRQSGRGDDFESRLLAHLKALVAARGDAASRREVAAGAAGPPIWRRRGPRLALVGALALVAIVTAIVARAGDGDGSTAFAVEPQPGGGVTIKIYRLEDAAGLEAALKEAGIRAQVSWLDAGMVCREPHYKPSVLHIPGGGTLGGMTMGGPGAGGITIAVAGTKSWRQRFGEYRRGEISAREYRESRANLTLNPDAFRPGQSVVISGAPVPYGGDPEGGSLTKLGIAAGPVEPCRPVPAPPSGNGAFGLNAEGGPAFHPHGDSTLGRAAVVADLHRAAAAAARADTQVEAPRPGQFLAERTKTVELQAWLPKGDGKGSKAHPRYFVPTNDPCGRYALVPVTKQVWTAPDGKEQVRETLGEVEFLSPADQRRWEEAGSPPPWAFDPAEHHVSGGESGRLRKEYRSTSFRGRHEFTYLARLSRLPTEPEALRLQIEHRRPTGSPLAPSPATSARGGATVERLLEILGEPLADPALRAAAFGALAEIPGIGFERNVIDAAGRRGDAIAWTRAPGFGRRFIFDPRTSQILAQAEVIFAAKPAGWPQVPDGTVFRETASWAPRSSTRRPGEPADTRRPRRRVRGGGCCVPDTLNR